MSNKKFVARHGLDANFNTISNVADPVNPGDVSTKNVTDTILVLANSAFDAANTGISIAQSAFNSSNNVGPQIEPAFNQANTGVIQAQAAFAAANNVAPQIEPAFNQANTGVIQAQAAFAAANNVAPQIEPAFNQANTGVIQAQAAFNQANTGVIQAQAAFAAANNEPIAKSAFNQANTGVLQAQAAFGQANTGIIQAQAAFAAANNEPIAKSAFNQANTGVTQAQAAFAASNTKFSSSGGTINGSVDITGSLLIEGDFTVSGNVTTISTNNIIVQDNMIYLNDGANVANPDLGFVGAYNDGTYRHTGFFRDATDGVWKLFDNYEPEPDESIYIDTSNSTFRIANFQANTVYANVYNSSVQTGISPFNILSTTLVNNLNSDLFDGYQSSYFINMNSNIFNQANTGVIQAQAAFAAANNEPIAKSAFGQANTGVIQAQAAFAAANNVAPQIEPAFNQANTGVIQAQAAFAAANNEPIAKSAFGQANTANINSANASFLSTGTVPVARLSSIPNSSLLNSSLTINGTSISLGGSGTVTAAAGTLTGSTLASGVTGSSLTSVGTITSGTWSGSFGAVSGANLTNLTAGNLSGTIPSAVLGNSTHYVGTTAIALNRSSGSQTLTGVSIDGNAATATALQTARTIGGVSFNGTANINLPGVNTAGNQNTSGNAATATKLATARAINGTNFDGSAAITTASWGTARTLTIGSTGKSVDGSGNVSWSLAEIGAAASSHTHSYLPLSGGTLSGTLNMYSGSYEGSILFGSNSTWRCGIRQHDDADAELRIWAKNSSGMIFLTTGYDGEPASISRPTNGLVVQNNNVGIGNFSSSDPLYDLHIADGGIGYATGSFRAPIFYDSNNTGYYTDLAGSTSINAAGLIIGSNINTYIKWLGTGISYDVDRTTKVSNGIAIYSAYSSGANNPWTYDISLQVNGNSRSFEISADWISSTSTGLKVRSLRDCCQNWSPWTDIATSGRSFTNSVDIRSPVFYDSSDTGYYINPNGDSRVSNLYSTAWFRNYGNQGIYNQDYGVHFYGQDSEGYCVTGSGGIVKLIFRSNHQSTVRGYVYGDTSNNFGFLNNGGSWRLRIVGGDYSLADGSSMRAQLYYDSNDTGYYVNPNSTSNMIRWTVRTTNTNLHSYGGSLGNEFIQWPGGTGCAGFSFHRSGYYAVNMALDNDNVIRIGGWSASANRLQMDMSGNLTMAGNVTAYSDIRLKENIKLIENPIEKIKQIRGVTFTRNDQDDKTKRHTGVIAQEVEVVLPEVISEDNEGVKNVAYGNMVGILIEAIKEQQTQLEQQQETINKLKSILNLE